MSSTDGIATGGDQAAIPRACRCVMCGERRATHVEAGAKDGHGRWCEPCAAEQWGYMRGRRDAALNMLHVVAGGLRDVGWLSAEEVQRAIEELTVPGPLSDPAAGWGDDFARDSGFTPIDGEMPS